MFVGFIEHFVGDRVDRRGRFVEQENFCEVGTVAVESDGVEAVVGHTARTVGITELGGAYIGRVRRIGEGDAQRRDDFRFVGRRGG